jgi:hypothetical protein
LSRYISSQLYEVTPADVASYAGAAALLTIVAMLATLVPARRAARIEPMRASAVSPDPCQANVDGPRS